MPPKVMIVVTHLLGTGHLARALTLGRAFAQEGWDCHVASGGMAVAHLDRTGLRLHQLPSLRSDGTDFTTLLDDSGTPATTGYRAARQRALLGLFDTLKPDILITELFPFGRRILKDEFTALLHAASQTDARVFASIRDILAPPSKPAKAVFADEMVAAHYTQVLVHSDPNAVTLDQSWPTPPALKEKLAYTGFVANPLPQAAPLGDGSGEVIVSAGGGDVGEALFAMAIEAARGRADTWRCLIPGHDAVEKCQQLQKHAPQNVICEPVRPDFRDLLQRARASVSLCGYNTAMDILQTGLPCVFVPFEEGTEVEQSWRANALSALPGIEMLRLPSGGAALATALERALQAPARDVTRYGFDGARKTVELCRHALR